MADDSNKTDKPNTSLEHPISELDAQKFAGQGDFSLPVSPLDQFSAAPAVAPSEPVIEYASPLDVISKPGNPASPVQPVPPAAPSLPPLDQVPSRPQGPAPTLPDTANTPQPVPADLETKAKDMLKELDKAAPPQRKRRGGSMVTKMALAAVVVTLMGTGGFLGMKLLNQEKAGQVAVVENRSDASGNVNPGACTESYCDGTAPAGYVCGTCTCTCVDGAQITNSCWRKAPKDQYSGPGDAHPDFSCDTACKECNHNTPNPNTCVLGSQCKACGFPEVAYCNNGTCGCIRYDQIPPDEIQCGELEKCTPDACPPDKEDCGVSGDNIGPGCVETSTCTGKCVNCQNKFTMSRYCKDKTSESYKCTKLEKDKTPKLNETVTFTCDGAATGTTINHYEFQYKIDSGTYTKLDPASNGSKTSKPLTISKAGTYTVQCRACKSTDSSDCTAWGLANK